MRGAIPMFGSERRGALLNALNAKATFENLSSDEKKSVVALAMSMYQGGGRPSPSPVREDMGATFDRMSEFVLYSLYSMAMEHSGISSVTGHPWSPPSNPMAMVYKLDAKQISNAASVFNAQFGLNVSLIG